MPYRRCCRLNICIRRQRIVEEIDWHEIKKLVDDYLRGDANNDRHIIAHDLKRRPPTASVKLDVLAA